MAMDTVLYSTLLPVDCGKLSSLTIDGRPAVSSSISHCKPTSTPTPLHHKGFLSLVPVHEREELWKRVSFHESDNESMNSIEDDDKVPWKMLHHDLLVFKDVSIDSRDMYGLSGSSSSSSSVAVQSLLPSSRHSQEDPEREKDFHVNVGYAIRTLREDLPNMFHKDVTYDIYRYKLGSLLLDLHLKSISILPLQIIFSECVYSLTLKVLILNIFLNSYICIHTHTHIHIYLLNYFAK